MRQRALSVPCTCCEIPMPHRIIEPFDVAKNFTGQDGKYVTLKDTIKGFNMIVNGECDQLPEQAFYMVGPIEEVVEKA